MNDQRDILLREYALAVGASDDRVLRDTLDQACLDCSLELAQAEADLAAFALALAPVAPSPGVGERVLARIRAERAARSSTAPAPAPVPAPSPASANQPPSTRQPVTPGAAAPAPRRRLGFALATAVLVAALGLGLVSARQDARLDAMSRQVAALGQSQRGMDANVTGIVERLDRFHQLGDRLRDSENRLAAREREVETLQGKFAILRSAEVVIALAGAEAQPKAQGRLYYAKAQRRWLLTMSNLAAPVSGRCYELWFITPGGQKIASETFVPTAEGLAEVMVEVPPGLEVAVAAVTDEPLGGVMVPTGKIHLVGKL